MKTVIKQLTEAFGPSGYETEVIDLIKTMVEAHVDEVNHFGFIAGGRSEPMCWATSLPLRKDLKRGEK